MNIEFDATFFAFVAFSLFIGLTLYVKAPAMIGKALDDRSRAIAHELSEARRLRDEAERLLADYTAKKAAAEAEASALIAHAQDQARLLTEEARANATESIARRKRQAEDRIAQAEAQAEASVRAAAADAAIAAAEKMLRDGLDAGAQSRLVQSGVEDLARKFN